MLMVITLVLIILEVIFSLVTISGLIMFAGQWSLILVETLVETDPLSARQSTSWLDMIIVVKVKVIIICYQLNPPPGWLGESVHCVLDPTIEKSQWIPSTFYHYYLPSTYYMKYLTILLNSQWIPLLPSIYLLCGILHNTALPYTCVPYTCLLLSTTILLSKAGTSPYS